MNNASQNPTLYDHLGRTFIEGVGNILTRDLSAGKLTPGHIEDRYGIPAAHVEQAMRGEVGPSQKLMNVVRNHDALVLADYYPEHLRDQFPVTNPNLVDGVYVVSWAKTEKSLRPLERDLGQGKIHFYNYGDMAMIREIDMQLRDGSTRRVGCILPEYIEEVFVHGTEVPDGGFNNGHLQQQITYSPKVLYGWKDKNGKRHFQVVAGIIYGTSESPHTFADPDGEGAYILAGTFNGRIGSREFQKIIKSMPVEEVLAEAKEVEQTLGAMLTDSLHGVMIRQYADTSKNAELIHDGLYKKTELLTEVPFQPHTRALELIIQSFADDKKFELVEPEVDILYFNSGTSDIMLRWQGESKVHEALLTPKSSAYVIPQVPHQLRNVDGGTGEVIALHAKAGMDSEEMAWKELALTLRYSGEEGVKKVRTATLWTKIY